MDRMIPEASWIPWYTAAGVSLFRIAVHPYRSTLNTMLNVRGCMVHECVTCGAQFMRTDVACMQCGNRLNQSLPPAGRRRGHISTSPPLAALAASAGAFPPAHQVSTAAAAPSKRRHRRRRARPWYRHRLVLVPVVLVLLAGSGMLAVGWRANSSISTLQQVSTPAPFVSGAQIGGDKAITIDTAPARQAVRVYPQQHPAAGEGSSVGNTVSGMTGGAAIAVGIKDTAPRQTMNILLMGVDARPGEAIDIGVRPDALAVLHLDAETGSCRMLSIPRDTRVELPGYGLSKINHALAVGGIPYQEQVVEQFLGIPIDHYGLIDFGGITQLVDAVGGVTIENPETFTKDGVTVEAGTHTLDGEHALIYARYRGGPDGDFGRVDRQQQVIRALIERVSGKDVITLVPRLLPLLEDHTRTSLGLDEIIGLATTYRSTCTEETLETETLAGTVATFPDPLLHLDLSYVIVDDAEVRKQVAWLLGEK